VVSTYPSEKYDFVNWDDEIPNVNPSEKYESQLGLLFPIYGKS